MKASDDPRKASLPQLSFVLRLMLSLLACLLICLVLVTASTQITTRRTLRENALNNSRQSIYNRGTLMEVNLAQISKLASNLYSNSDVYHSLQQEVLSGRENYRLTTFVRSMMTMTADIDLYQIYLDIYNSKSSVIVSANGNSSFGASHYHVGIPKEMEADQLYCEGPHLSNNYGYSVGGAAVLVYTFHWQLLDNAQTHAIGTISFDVPLQEMTQLAFPEENTAGFLIQDEDIVFCNQRGLSDQNAHRILEDCICSGGWSSVTYDDFEGIAFHKDVSFSNRTLHLVQLVSNQELYGDSDRLLVTNLLLILTTFLLCAAAMYLTTGYITRPIRQMDACMQEIESSGDLAYRMKDRIDYTASDEVGNLIRQTDRMLETLEESFQRQQILSQAQREAEARMLQAQINPHFLYNSLQSLAALALSHGDRELFNYITLLGERMHYSMNIKDTTATLSQEVEYIRQYLVLQDLRFGNGMQADFHVSPEAEGLIVPRMILQPLAENAFKHGKLCRTPGTFLRLTAGIDQGVLEIVMDNNGNLIPPERVEELNRQFAVPGVPDSARDEHIGMLSVLYRLRLFFSDEASMEIESPAAGEPEVHVRIRLRVLL